MTTADTHSGGDATGRAAGWIGSLADTPLAEVLQRIVHEGRSGDLQVTLPDAVKTVYFDRGFVALASSSVMNDRLGESMIEAGRISRHEFALASMVMKASNRKFGETLVQAGILSEEELGHYVATQVNRIVLSLFSAKTGRYSFDERPCSVPVELMVSLSVYRILLEGVRRMTRKKLVVAGLPARETRLKVASEPPFSLDVAQLRRVEKDVLRAAGEGASIARIAKTLGGDEGVVLRAAYGLYCAGVLEAVEVEKPGRRLRVQEETGTFVLSEIRRKVEPKREAPPPAPTPLEVEAPAVELVLEPTLEPGGDPAPPTPMPPSEPEKPQSDLEPSIAPVAGQRRAHPPPSSCGSRSLESVKSSWLRRVLQALWPLLDRVERAMLRWVGSHAAEVETLDVAAPPPTPAEPAKDRPEAFSSTAAADERDGERVGVPSWSMAPTPEAPTESLALSEPPGEELEGPGRRKLEAVGVPSWSMKDDPAEPVLPIESPPAAWSFEETPGGAAEDVAPLSSLDHELFIEGEPSGDDAPSMLSHIPVEEIDVDVDVDVDVEFELDAEPFSGLAEDAETAAFVPEEPEPSKAAFPVIPEMEDALQGAHAARPELPERPSSPPISNSASEPALESDDAPLPSESPATGRADAMLRVKQGGGETRLLRDVRLHFKLQDWEGAVPLLDQLVQISPGSALYRGMLARAMSRLPMMRKDAEEHFIEALRLAPHDAELHYWLGLYYKSFGLKSRAYTEFRTTLRIDPKHEGARSQLAGGRKDDAIGAVFKKLFG